MYTYFKIDGGSIVETITRARPLSGHNTKAAAQANGKPWLVPVAVTDPPHDPATQVREGPVDAYDGVTATRVYTIRAKTAAELAADQKASDQDLLARSATDIALVIAELVDAGVVNTGGFTAAAQAALGRVKPPADRLRGLP